MNTRPQIKLRSTWSENRTPQILHVMHFDKFIAPFISCVEECVVDFDRHLFFCFGEEAHYPMARRSNTLLPSDFPTSRLAYLELARQMNRAEKIILHGLFNTQVVQLLSVQPWLLKKCFWVIWGGDLYEHRIAERNWRWYKQEIFRRFVIKRLGHLVTFIEGDVDLARQWYDARGWYHSCLMYPSNLYREGSVPTRTDSTINIQIGNSADPSNEHFEILQTLERYKDQNIRIYAPLSYGDPKYAQRLAKVGAEIFGEKFVALTEFIPFDDYVRLLGNIDVALFNYQRQQGMGNIITLLGLGKKVYLRGDITPWQMFERIGIKLYDIADFDLTPIDWASKKRNQEVVESKFSKRILFDQLRGLFGS